MDKVGLTGAIAHAIESGATLIDIPPYMNPDSYLAQRLRRSGVTAGQGVIEELVSKLREEEDLRLFDGGVMLVSSGGFRMQLTLLAQWLIAQALHSNPQEVVERLDTYLSLDHNPAWEIVAIAGLELERPVELIDEIRLVPFDHLPRSEVTDGLSGVPSVIAPSPLVPDRRQTPAAALIAPRKQKPKLALEFPETPEVSSLGTTMFEICHVLTLIGPSAPIPIAHWVYLEDWIPLATSGSGLAVLLHEVPSKRPVSITDSEETIRDLVQAYFRLSPSVREKLKTPLTRLNLALRRSSPVDTAIELRIALESLLAQDLDANAPISYTVRLRGSHLGADKLEERLELYETLGKVYRICSQAVHQGGFSKKDEKKASDILAVGAEICGSLIGRIIEQGRIPEWKSLILGAPFSEQENAAKTVTNDCGPTEQITTKEAAQLTGYTSGYFGQLIRCGHLRAQKRGHAWFLDKEEVLAFAEKRGRLGSKEHDPRQKATRSNSND